MNDCIILSFTIAISVLGIAISAAALVFSIIYLIKISKLQKTQDNISNTFAVIEEIKTILIAQCCLFSDTGMIKGAEAIKLIQEQYNCDEFTAIKIYYGQKEKENKDA